MAQIECSCGQKIEIPDDYTAETIACPRCKLEVKIDIFPRSKEKLKSALEYAAESGPPRCPACKKLIEDGELTCPYCGAPIPEAVRTEVERPEERPLPLAHEETGFFRLLKGVFTRPLVTMEAFADYFSYPSVIIKVFAFYLVTLLLVALYGVYSAEKGDLLYFSVVINLAANIAGILAISAIIHLTSVYLGLRGNFLQTFVMVLFISGIINALIALPMLVYGIGWLAGMGSAQRVELLRFLRLLLYPVKVMLLTLAVARMLRYGIFFSFLISVLGVLVEFGLFGLMSIALAAGRVGHTVWRRDIGENLI